MKYLCISFIIFIKELFIKNIIEDTKTLPKKKIFKETFGLTKVKNTGLMFSLLSNEPEKARKIAVRTAGAFIGAALPRLLSKNYSRTCKFGLSLMLGGALSNVYDRIFRGYVVDYVSINKGPKQIKQYAFNLSDVCIIAGCILIMISGKKDKKDEIKDDEE